MEGPRRWFMRTRALGARVAPLAALVAALAVSLIRGASPAIAVAAPIVEREDETSCSLLRRTLRFDAAYMSAVLEGSSTIPLLLAARAGRMAAAAATVERLGGRVDYRDHEVDYVRVTLPTTALPAVACSELVEALEVDALMGVDDVTQPLPALTSPPRSPDATAPAIEPRVVAEPGPHVTAHRPSITVPLHEMGVDQFLKAHPTFDGRGVTIAFIEWAPDLLDVQTWTAGGRRTKVLRPLFTWPTTPHQAVVGLRPAVARGTWALVNGQGYRVPPRLRDRDVLVGAIDERRIGSYYGGDLNRDGNPSGASPYLGVLRDPTTHEIWIDVQQNRDWTDDAAFRCGEEPPLTIGRDDVRTPTRESVGVWILCEATRPAEILVVPTANRHMTTLAATAVAAALPFGAHGIAPGAHLLPVLQLRPGHTSALIESALLAFRDARADILTMGLSAQRRLHDGQSVAPLVLDRGVRHYQKVLFSAVGNGPIGLETLSEAATGREIVSVGAYASPETLAATHGIADQEPGRPYWLGMHGPRADGALKPDVVATAAAYLPASRVWPAPRQTPVALAPGYRLAWGTSLSAPAAASAAALLLSGARQLGAAPSAAALRAALVGAAQRLPQYQTAEQGAGLLSVPAAWDALQRGVQQRVVEVQAPVVTRLVRAGDVPAIGPGLFEREGWTTRHVGTRQTRTLVLTRRDGPVAPERFRIAVEGDEAFVVPRSTISLPLNTPIALPVQITPRRPGLHTAIVRLTEVTAGRIWTQVPLTLVVAHEAPDAPDSLTLRGTIAFAHFTREFIHVPEGSVGLTLDADAATQAVRPRLLNPAGQPAPAAGATARGPWHYGVDRPEPGVWELLLNNAEGAISGVAAHAQPPRGTYALTVRVARSTPVPPPRDTSPVTRVTGVLTGAVSFVQHDFYVSRPDSTIVLTSQLAESSACHAEHRLILERCDGRQCVPAIGSETTALGTTLTVPPVGTGVWRGVLWRTTPATCAQEVTLDVSVGDGGTQRRDTARRQ